MPGFPKGGGHDAWSCDIEPTDGDPAFHFQGDIFEVLKHYPEWDMMIAHPECRYLANSGVKLLYKKGHSRNGRDPARWKEMKKAADFYNRLADVDIPRKAIENPVMHRHALKLVGGFRADQFVQPWWFGSKKNKATGFRLINLPKLIKTNVVGPMPKTVKKGTAEYRSWNECWYMSPGPERSRKRAMTDPAVAQAIADQWGNL